MENMVKAVELEINECMKFVSEGWEDGRQSFN